MKARITSLLVCALVALLAGSISLAAPEESAAPADRKDEATGPVVSQAPAENPLDLAEEAKGKPPKPAQCCDPALEPGTNGNPFCFEGHTCCSDGVWRCNNPDATPSCEAGQVCDEPPSCGGKNSPCDTGDDCCSGKCKPNGRCA
jgi:hypothetical protein